MSVIVRAAGTGDFNGRISDQFFMHPFIFFKAHVTLHTSPARIKNVFLRRNNAMEKTTVEIIQMSSTVKKVRLVALFFCFCHLSCCCPIMQCNKLKYKSIRGHIHFSISKSGATVSQIIK